MNRYLVSKGWEGFCDRLQCLSNCINFSLTYNRILCVDWSDRIWTQGDESFYTYFCLVDLPYVESIHQIPRGLDTYPEFWKNGLGLTTDEWIHKLKDNLALNVEEGKHFEPIWVHPGVGFRRYDFNQLPKHLRLTTQTATEIKPLLARVNSTLPVVHLRGTDRAFTEERWQHLRQQAPVANVLSDDARLTARWMSESPESIVLSDTMTEAKQGGHKLKADEIAKLGYTKHQMNIRLITDFLTIASAKEVFALNEESLFFKMSRLFGACHGVEAILQTPSAPQDLQGAFVRPFSASFQKYTTSLTQLLEPFTSAG